MIGYLINELGIFLKESMSIKYVMLKVIDI